MRTCSFITSVFFHLLYNIKSVLNIYEFASHNFNHYYKVLNVKPYLLTKIIHISKICILSVARQHSGTYSITYQIRPSPLERTNHQEYYTLTLLSLSKCPFNCELWREEVIGQNKVV